MPIKKSLFRSFFTVSGFTLLSRIMGLVRDILFASFFGAGMAMDAFSVAFRIPNLFRRFFGEGAFNQAFVPVFSEYRTQRDEASLKEFLANISGTLGAVLIVITILGIVFSPAMVMLFASGFRENEAKFLLTNDLVKLMIPYIFFICMTAMYSSTLNALDRFAVPALVPILLNIALIIGALLSPLFETPIMALGVAVFIGGMLQLGTVFYTVKRQGIIIPPKVAFNAPGVKRVMWLMLPALIGSSSSQINILINTQLASHLEVGSVTWLYYSDRLVEFALGTFAVALGTVILPRFSRLNAKKDLTNLRHTIDWGLTLALVLGIPSMIALFILAEPLLALLFMRGAFTLTDVKMSGYSLSAYALSIPAFFIIRILAPVYFARQDTKTPMTYSLIAIGVNIVLQFILVQFLKHAGLALSSSVAAWINAGLLIYGLHHRQVHAFTGFINRQRLVLIPVNILLAIMLYWIASYRSFWVEDSLMIRLGAMLLTVIVSVVLYFGLIDRLGLKLASLKEPIEE